MHDFFSLIRFMIDDIALRISKSILCWQQCLWEEASCFSYRKRLNLFLKKLYETYIDIFYIADNQTFIDFMFNKKLYELSLLSFLGLDILSFAMYYYQ